MSRIPRLTLALITAIGTTIVIGLAGPNEASAQSPIAKGLNTVREIFDSEGSRDRTTSRRPAASNGLRKRLLLDGVSIEVSEFDADPRALVSAPPSFSSWFTRELSRELNQTGRYNVLPATAEVESPSQAARLQIRLVQFAVSDLSPEILRERIDALGSSSDPSKGGLPEESGVGEPDEVDRAVDKAKRDIISRLPGRGLKTKTAVIVLGVSLFGPDGAPLNEWQVTTSHRSVMVGDFGINSQNPITTAGRKAMESIRNDLQRLMGQVLWETVVSEVDGTSDAEGIIVIASGRNEGVKVGDTFDVLRPARVVKGRSLPARAIGQCRVSRVEYDSAEAVVQMRSGQLVEQGYIVRQQDVSNLD